ncbi:hypothetical protein V5O48_011946 [Marasmius crinis-equi]|uniref:Uncharacterized protein n=1 Tax=Marasmius crinis-equi TaxID=585013 RepID=A0ABR3F475_9AGAR
MSSSQNQVKDEPLTQGSVNLDLPPSGQPRVRNSCAPSTPEGRAARNRAIEEALRASSQVVKNHEDLFNAEQYRQTCEDSLMAANRDLDAKMGELQNNATAFSQTMAQVNAMFGLATTANQDRNVQAPTAVPTTPTTNRTVYYSASSAPSTPSTARTMSPPATPSRRPGGVVEAPPPTPIVGRVHTGNRLPAYVVYHGKDNRHGVFESWRAVDYLPELPFAAAIGSVTDVVCRGFRSIEMARDYYSEAVEDGIIDILNTPPRNDEYYIVTKGAKPGVYTQRGFLMKEGLQWRGGEVTVWVGTLSAARDQFRAWVQEGLTETYHYDVKEADL